MKHNVFSCFAWTLLSICLMTWGLGLDFFHTMAVVLGVGLMAITQAVHVGETGHS